MEKVEYFTSVPTSMIKGQEAHFRDVFIFQENFVRAQVSVYDASVVEELYEMQNLENEVNNFNFCEEGRPRRRQTLSRVDCILGC